MTVSLSFRRQIVYASLTAIIVGGSLVAALLGADVYAHRRVRASWGVNVWGYRGEILDQKRPKETRIVMLGGSTVFASGIAHTESVPALLDHRLNVRSGAAGQLFTVANLGAPGQGAYSFLFDLADYAYLEYDIVLIYEGYNDLGLFDQPVANYFLWRRESPVFRLTSYYPILPLILREKGTALLHGGDITNADRGDRVVFRPGLAAQVAAGSLAAAASVSENLARQIGRLSERAPTPAVDDQCVPQWKQYCGAVRDAVVWALERDKSVLFITQPYVSDSHVEQQANVAAMLQARFGGDRRLRYLNLGRAIDLHDQSIAFDGLHLNATGNDTIAEQLVEPVLALSRR